MASFPFVALEAQNNFIKKELDRAVAALFASSSFIGGDAVVQFEDEMARYSGCGHAIGVDSGTRALELILRALGVGAGDEVITTPFSFIATAAAIVQVGARPLFVDIDPVTYNLSAEGVAEARTTRTKAVLPVHLFGMPADMDSLRTAAGGLPIIGDGCQAIGATYQGHGIGALGEAAALSFFPTKNLGGAGDGGMVLTNNHQLAQRLRELRNHGRSEAGEYLRIGYTARLDALQAAILRVKLQYIDQWNKQRQENAAFYTQALAPYLDTPTVTDGSTHVFHQYTVRCDRREQLAAYLRAQGVPTACYYPLPIHLQPVFAEFGYRVGDLPHAERAAKEVLSLPICPFLEPVNRDRVVEAVRSFFTGSGSC